MDRGLWFVVLMMSVGIEDIESMRCYTDLEATQVSCMFCLRQEPPRKSFKSPQAGINQSTNNH